MHTTHPRGQAGFSIIELVVSIAVLGLLAGSVGTMFNSIRSIQLATRHRDTATRAAQRQVEIFRTDNYSALPAGSSVNFTSQLPASLPRDRNGTAVVSEPTPGLRRADITITYTANGKMSTQKYSALIGVIGITK